MNTFFSLLKSKELYIGILRYGLGMIMIGYGLFKIRGIQGGVISPASSWQLPLEALHGNQLVWAFVGYSRWFQFLLGLLEFIPACLLLFRRTQLLGAVLMLPMTLGVFFVNFGLDLWQFTKVGSSVLLAVNITIILGHWQKVKEIARLLLETVRKRKFGWLELSVNIAIILYFSSKLLKPKFDPAEGRQAFCGDCFNHHPNEWILIRETINDSLLAAANLRCYFTPKGVYSEINDRNKSTGYLMYQVDTGTSSLSIEKGPYYEYETFLLPDAQDTSYYTNFTYTFTGDSLLALKSENGHIRTFRRRVINEGRF